MFNRIVICVMCLNSILTIKATAAESYPVPEASRNFHIVSLALLEINSLQAIAESTLQNLVDESAESRIKIEVESSLKNVNDPFVLSRVAILARMIAFPQNAEERAFDVTYDIAFSSAIGLIGRTKSKDALSALREIEKAIKLGSFEKMLIEESIRAISQ